MAGVYRGPEPLDELAGDWIGLDDWAAQTQAIAQAEWRIRGEDRHPTYGRGADGTVVELNPAEPAEIVPLDQRSHDEQRRALEKRLGPAGLARYLSGGQIDPMQGRPVAAFPDFAPPARVVVDEDGRVGIETADEPIGSFMPVEEIIAREEQRKAERQARDEGRFDGPDTEAEIVQMAAGPKPPGQRRNDKTPKARPAVGPTTNELYEQLLRNDERGKGGRPRKGRDVRERFSVRAEPATRATIAQTGRTESDFIEEAAKLVAMARTGADADELMRAIIALAWTGESESAA